MTLIQFELFSFCSVNFLPNKAHGMNTQVGKRDPPWVYDGST